MLSFWILLYPNDYGFDPLGLLDPEGAGGFIEPKWLAYGEVVNRRFAMLEHIAIGSIPTPYSLSKWHLWDSLSTKDSRTEPTLGHGKKYFLGLEKGLGRSSDPAYPDGPFFNPLGLGKDEKSMKELKLKEMKNRTGDKRQENLKVIGLN
ncbi:chlorophyll a-b binding 8, chloroplastic [Olea europaea subsp. europaea]|uniref:Chlorophyll a-b binding protein, chloroplastic n=1 Tax=Olea europaea subsp. europaea TaxID=158383 RepID=A0A8S0SZP9_OLEEU|nr:chlorophyll a-b binding 8, chloroplastic [Olea europaea subsp. europaea]